MRKYNQPIADKPGTIHHGNGNYKRRYTNCGMFASFNDSIDVDKVNCILCIEVLLQNQKWPTRKTEAWKIRLKELKNEIHTSF